MAGVRFPAKGAIMEFHKMSEYNDSVKYRSPKAGYPAAAINYSSKKRCLINVYDKHGIPMWNEYFRGGTAFSELKQFTEDLFKELT